MTLKDEQWAILVEEGICGACQEAHTVNLARLHLSWYCSHSQKAICIVAGAWNVSEGLALKDYLEFVTDLQRRISGAVN